MNLALPESTSSTDLKSYWKRPEGKASLGVLAVLAGGLLYYGEDIVQYLLGLFTDLIHLGELAGILGLSMYMVFGKRPRMLYRVLMQYATSIFVPVFAKQIIQDKLLQMKKRREKMATQISLVSGQLQVLKRTIAQNHADATKGFGMASQAQKMAANTQDANEQLRMQLQMKKNARQAQRREQANIGYQQLLDKLTNIYNFLTRYAANIDFFIEDTEDEIDQKLKESQTVGTAYGAMTTAMSVIKGNATEEDMYDKAFDSLEQTVSTQLGIMDDLQRVSQNFMDGMDVETGAVDDAALQALNAFEQKALNAGNTDFNMVTTNVRGGSVSIPVAVPALSTGSKSNDFDPFN